MHVVVGQSMADEQMSVEFLISVHRRDVVSRWIFLWCAHISLGVRAVVIAPVGDRSHSDTTAEDRSSLTHRHDGVESSEAPSPDGDTILVDIGERSKIESRLHLVF